MSPPPVVVVKVRDVVAAEVIGRLIVCNFVPLFVTFPPSVMPLPLKVNAAAVAPGLKMIPLKVCPAKRLLFNTAPALPATPKINTSRAIGGLFVPVQFKSAQFTEVFPTQVILAARPLSVRATATARRVATGFRRFIFMRFGAVGDGEFGGWGKGERPEWTA